MIVGTAGHIDHGKLTLVKALTGVDIDRLPEEKKRGFSIELGYVFLDVPGLPERIGFIDVPGHERLVHTMLAGATGIDAALLLVAADDGVMPQAREHLAVLALRGAFVHRPEHAQRLSAVDERIAQKVAPRLTAAGAQGAWARDLAADIGESEPLVRVTLARLAQRGELHQVVKDLFVSPEVLAQLVRVAQDTARAGDGHSVTAAAFRDRTGLGRKRAIQLLEYLDRIGVLRRVGDEHRLRRDSPLLGEAASA